MVCMQNLLLSFGDDKMDLKKSLKKIFEGNVFNEDDELDFGINPNDYQDTVITNDNPDDKVLKIQGVPKGKKPVRFMGVPVDYDQSTLEKYKQALHYKSLINKYYSGVKNFIENYYIRKLGKKVNPNQMQIEDPEGIMFPDALIKNFKLIRGYKDSGATFEDILKDMISVDFEKLLENKKQNISMVELQKYLTRLGINYNKFKEYLKDDLIERLMNSNSQEIQNFKDKFESSKSTQKRSAKSNIVKKSRHKVELSAKEFEELLNSIPIELRNSHVGDYQRFKKFLDKIPEKIKKIQNNYINERDFDATVHRFENLEKMINQNSHFLKMIMT